MPINISWAVTTRAKLPAAPLALGQFRKVGRISSLLLINISRKRSQTFLIFYSQYRSVTIASKLSPFLNKAPVKEYYSLTVQQQSSAGRRIRFIIIISSLPNQVQSTLQLTRRGTRIFKYRTPPAEGLLSLTSYHESEPDPRHTSALCTGSRRKAQIMRLRLPPTKQNLPQALPVGHQLAGDARRSPLLSPFLILAGVGLACKRQVSTLPVFSL